MTLALCAAALELTGFKGDARKECEVALWSGRATAHFAEMVAYLGGPADFVERMDKYLTPAPIVRDVFPTSEGVVTAIDTRAVGMAVVALGGGRRVPTDTIDHAVGFDRLVGLGTLAGSGVPLARIHARDEATATDAAARLVAAYKLGDSLPPTHPLIAERIDPPEAR